MIGLFDSGIGGLTVVRELLRRSPDVSFVYLGDTARTPYGNKSPETVVRYVLEDAEFLLSHGATSIVIACNSASAVATDALRAAHPTIPVFEVITPAVEAACQPKTKRVGVIGTRATIASGSYEKLLHAKGVEVVAKSCPLFVPLVEEGWLDEVETKRIAKHYLSSMRQANVDALILGCTHYPLLSKIIQRFMGKRVRLVDSGATVVERVLQSSEGRTHGSAPTGEIVQRYFLTDLSVRSDEIAAQWLKRPVRFEKAKLE